MQRDGGVGGEREWAERARGAGREFTKDQREGGGERSSCNNNVGVPLLRKCWWCTEYNRVELNDKSRQREKERRK